MLKRCKYFLVFCLVFWNTIQAQDAVFNEVGVVFGSTVLLSDYGKRGDLKSNINNTGFGISLVHYLSFENTLQNISYAKQHFKFRSELSYNKTILNHYSEWLKNNPNSEDAKQLIAMETKTFTFNLGSQLEYYPLDKSYNITETPKKFSPYVSLGFLFSFYFPTTYSSLGDLGTNEATFAKYLVPSDGHQYGFTSKKGSTWSFVYGLGTRYKLFDRGAIIIEGRYQWFNSDWIDGLNISKE